MSADDIEALTDDLRLAMCDMLTNGPNDYDDKRIDACIEAIKVAQLELAGDL